MTAPDVVHFDVDIDEQLIELAQKTHRLVDRADVARVMTSGQWSRRLASGA